MKNKEMVTFAKKKLCFQLLIFLPQNCLSAQKWHGCQVRNNKQPKYFFLLEFDIWSWIAAVIFVVAVWMPRAADLLHLIGTFVTNLSTLALPSRLFIV